MLLRSSSTPVLECLLSPVFHSEHTLDAKIERSAGEGHGPMSISLPTPKASTHLHLDSPFRPTCLESPGTGLPPSNHIRRAQSESDLCSLASGGSLTPAKVAADSLLQDSLVEGCTPFPSLENHTSSSCIPNVRKGRPALPPLGRRRSLGSLPFELPSVFFNDDSASCDLTILEEVEITPSSSVASEIDEERAGILDKIALPVGKFVTVKKDVDLFSDSDGEAEAFFGTSQAAVMQETGAQQREAHMFPLQADMVASPSGRWEPAGISEQRSSMLTMSRKGSTSMAGSTLEKETCVPFLQSRHANDGEDLEVACNGGNSGRGARPPSITGGRGGGGDTWGRSGGGQDVADQHYQFVLQKDPGNPLFLRNYAQYLAEVKHDYRKAEEFFERAILASPTDGELLGQYAKMLWEVKHDTERAATYFERAVQAAPDNSYVMAAYAAFLWSSEEDEEGQEGSGSGPSAFPASFPSLVSAGLA